MPGGGAGLGAQSPQSRRWWGPHVRQPGVGFLVLKDCPGGQEAGPGAGPPEAGELVRRLRVQKEKGDDSQREPSGGGGQARRNVKAAR